jgi:hypothetical protein
VLGHLEGERSAVGIAIASTLSLPCPTTSRRTTDSLQRGDPITTAPALPLSASQTAWKPPIATAGTAVVGPVAHVGPAGALILCTGARRTFH